MTEKEFNSFAGSGKRLKVRFKPNLTKLWKIKRGKPNRNGDYEDFLKDISGGVFVINPPKQGSSHGFYSYLVSDYQYGLGTFNIYWFYIDEIIPTLGNR